MIDTLYVLNRAVQACYRQRRDTNRGEIEYLMLAFSQFHSLFSNQKFKRSVKLNLSQVSAQLFVSHIVVEIKYLLDCEAPLMVF